MTSEEPGSERRWVASIVGLAGGLAALGVDAVYLLKIAQQGVTPPGGRVVFVAGWIACAGLVAIVGALMHRPAWRAALLGVAAAMLFALAAPAVFSIGIPLFLCGILVAGAAIRAAEMAEPPRWVGLVMPLGLLVLAALGVAIGFALTDF